MRICRNVHYRTCNTSIGMYQYLADKMSSSPYLFCSCSGTFYYISQTSLSNRPTDKSLFLQWGLWHRVTKVRKVNQFPITWEASISCWKMSQRLTRSYLQTFISFYFNDSSHLRWWKCFSGVLLNAGLLLTKPHTLTSLHFILLRYLFCSAMVTIGAHAHTHFLN